MIDIPSEGFLYVGKCGILYGESSSLQTKGKTVISIAYYT